MKNMDRKIILGATLGAVTTLGLSFGILFGLTAIFGSLTTSSTSKVISAFGTISILLPPVAGGFLAGLVGRSNPKKAGLFSGLSASLVILIAWLIMSGFNSSTLITGVVIVFIWVVLARLASGFVPSKLQP